MPRLQTIPVTDLKREILAARQEVVDQHKIASKSAAVWEQIGLKCNVKASSVYTFVICDRYNIRTELGVEQRPNQESLESAAEMGSSQPYVEEDKEPSSEDEDVEYDENVEGDDEKEFTQHFTVTISPEEWLKMSPMPVAYKRSESARPNIKSREYTVFRDSEWTTIMQEHFWAHTSLPCCLAFKRGKLFTPAAQSYCVLNAECRDCKSKFRGVIKTQPKRGARVLVHCSYSRKQFEESCRSKRRLIGTSRVEAVKKLTEQRMSASMYRRQMASAVMEAEDAEPSHIPNENVLRVAKSKAIAAKRLDNNPVISLSVARSRPPLLGVVRDIGYNRFFVHYWSSLQINVYNEYCRNIDYPQISIDATGGIVKRILFEGGDKSGHIFLYEITIHDASARKQFSVSNMLSERHDTNSITYWLSEWIRTGASRPKLIVTDMSLALQAAVVRSFTRFQSLSEYVKECSKVLNPLSSPIDLPECQIRCDVAHVVKSITMWSCLHGKAERIRQFYIRSMAQLIQCTQIDDARQLLEAIFTVACCETEGRDTSTNEETLCEQRKRWLKNRIAGDLPNEINTQGIDIAAHSNSETEDAANDLWLESEDSASFESWAQAISAECHRCAEATGDRDNLQYMPGICSTIIRLMRSFPLWSAVMIPVFNYGGITASSASVESSFNDVKHRMLAHKQLPLRVDDFLQIHAAAIDGSMKIAAAPNRLRPSTSNSDMNQEQLHTSAECNQRYSPADEIERSEFEGEESAREQTCPACSAGDEPQGAHKCFACSRPVHPFPECSSPVAGEEEGYGERRMCRTCARRVTGENNEEATDYQRPASDRGNTERTRGGSNVEMHHVENWRNLASASTKRPRKYLDTEA